MAYKAGTKYICECRIGHTDDGEEYKYFSPLGELVNGVEQHSYNKGMKDAWAMAQRLHMMNGGEVEDAFMPQGAPFYHDADTAIRLHTVFEAKEKLEAYDDKCNKIKVGDAVTCNRLNGIVIETLNDKCSVVLYGGDNGAATVHNESLTKTGNNYAAELRELLGKIGGAADE